jgi:hypothetical protein
MESMFSGLLSLALISSFLSFANSLEPLPPGVSSTDLQIGSLNTSLERPRIRLCGSHADVERDCVDDTDESSSVKQRTQELDGVPSRSERAISRTVFERGHSTPRGVLLPLFRVFCKLLI